jgi:hypothetical protein
VHAEFLKKRFQFAATNRPEQATAVGLIDNANPVPAEVRPNIEVSWRRRLPSTKQVDELDQERHV